MHQRIDIRLVDLLKGRNCLFDRDLEMSSNFLTISAVVYGTSKPWPS
jgi:hypothetical protein